MSEKMPHANARMLLEPLLTVEDLEQMLRVDKRTIARLCKRGDLPKPLKLGGSNRWRVEDIADTLNGLASLARTCRQEEVFVTVS